MKEWIFVHNNAEGITTSISDKIEEIRTIYPNINIKTVTRAFLKDQLHDRLSLQQLIDVYPSANLNFNKVQMDHIRPLLKRIVESRTNAPDPNNFGEIPDESKLDYNKPTFPR